MSYDEVKTQTITGTSTWSATVQGPVDGYRAYATTVNTGLQTLINNDNYLEDRTSRLRWLPGQTGSLCTLFVDLVSCFGDEDTHNVYSIRAYDTSANKVPPRVYAQMSEDSPLWFRMPWLPAYAKIKNVYFNLMCPAAGSLPTNMPTFDLVRKYMAPGVETLTTIAVVTDASADISTFNGLHAASVENINIKTYPSFEYFIRFHKDLSYPGVYITSLRFDLVSGE